VSTLHPVRSTARIIDPATALRNRPVIGPGKHCQSDLDHGADRRLLTPGIENGSAPADGRAAPQTAARPEPNPQLKEKTCSARRLGTRVPSLNLTRSRIAALPTQKRKRQLLCSPVGIGNQSASRTSLWQLSWASHRHMSLYPLFLAQQLDDFR
jgi:hypothetical protein